MPARVLRFVTLLPLRALQAIPGGVKAQAFVGTGLVFGLCAYPLYSKRQKAGHALFDTEKPEAVQEHLDARKRTRAVPGEAAR